MGKTFRFNYIKGFYTLLLQFREKDVIMMLYFLGEPEWKSDNKLKPSG